MGRILVINSGVSRDASVYRVDGDGIVLTRTIVPERFSGHGLASKLVHGTFETIRSSRRKAVLLCPLMAAYYARHPEYADIVATESSHD